MQQVHPEYTNPSSNSNISPMFGCQEKQNENKKIFFQKFNFTQKKKIRDSINKIRELFVYLLLDLNFRVPILKIKNKK